jgi:hypothetical protein
MTLIAPVLAALIGLVVYGLANGKASEAGRLTFACGLLVALYVFAHHGVRVL